MRASIAVMLALVGQAAADSGVERFAEGRRLMEAGKYAEACAAFEAALAVEKDAPGVLLNLGMCNAEQHKLATALRWFRQAKVRATEQGDVPSLSAANEHIAKLAPQVGRIRLRPSEPLPSGAQLTIDGAAADPAALAKLEIDPGHHVIELHGGGLAEVRQEIDVDPDATVGIGLAVSRPAVMAETGRAPAYTIGGIGLGLLAGTAVLGIVGKHEYDDASDQATRDRWANIVRYGGSSMFVLGIAGVATGVVLLVKSENRVSATVTPDRVAITIERGF
jgi:tetratricopeptide (TPR) repeat protein